MSEEKKTAVTEEVKEEVRKLTEEELAQVTGGKDVRPGRYKRVGGPVGDLVGDLGAVSE